MNDIKNKDTRFPGQPAEPNCSIEEEREPLIHFHSPEFLIFETRKFLATAVRDERRERRVS
jgi:hypothetical protein